jgi:hypothetical protein
MTSNGRQQISQSVVKRWDAMLVSKVISKDWPQNGHWMVAETSIRGHYAQMPQEQRWFCVIIRCTIGLWGAIQCWHFGCCFQFVSTNVCARALSNLLSDMAGFFQRNISFQGRMARGITGTLLLISGIITADFTLWAAIPLVVVGLFCIFEAVRGWCFLRACGVRTKV